MERCGIFLHKAIVKVESKKASGDARICSPLRFRRIGDESLRHGTRSCIESKPQMRGANNTHHDNDDDDNSSSSHAMTRHERSSASEKNSFKLRPVAYASLVETYQFCFRFTNDPQASLRLHCNH